MKGTRKRVGSLVVTAALLLSLLPTIALATGPTNWADEISVKGMSFIEEVSRGIETYTYYKSDGGAPTAKTVVIDKQAALGSETNPIGISTEAELILFGQQSKDATKNKFYILDKPNGVYDMQGDSRYMLPLFATVASTQSGMPAPVNGFLGTLAGNGATIQNASIGDYDTQTVYEGGLLSYMETAQICGLKLKNSTIYADASVSISNDSDNTAGGLVGFAASSVLADCHADGVIFINAENYATKIGGLAGKLEDGYLLGCTATGDISLTFDSASHNIYAGGLVGDAAGFLFSCAVSGSVSVTARDDTEYSSALYVGGLAGSMYSAVNSSHSGAVSGSLTTAQESKQVNAFVGGIGGDGVATSCWHRGGVTGSVAGGSEYSASFAGGILGSQASVEYSYWDGASQLVGGGLSNYTSATACGTIGGDGNITAGTAANCGTEQVLANGATALNAASMNAGIGAWIASDVAFETYRALCYDWTDDIDPLPLKRSGSATVTALAHPGKTVYLDTTSTKTSAAIELTETGGNSGVYTGSGLPYPRQNTGFYDLPSKEINMHNSSSTAWIPSSQPPSCYQRPGYFIT